ncbi:MAG: ABC transporter permease [Fimbriimonadaceae bacterium]|nr:ABC transporter permease [Fimbriimonadaceae bacterium]
MPPNSSRDWRQKLAPYRGLLALALVFGLGCLFSPTHLKTGQRLFLTVENQRTVFFEIAETGILAAGMTLVILTGGIDLAVGSVLGLSATAFALAIYGYGASPLTAVLVALLVGAGCGLLNGLVIARLRLQPFVATLAMMVAARGAAKWLSLGVKVAPGAQDWYVWQQSAEVPFMRWLTTALGGWGPQPMTLLFLLTIAALAVLLGRTRFGRTLYAIGGNEEATRLSGISAARAKVWAYLLCGLCAGLAGICDAAQLTLGDPEAGATYELDAIAAVVIGGTSLAGGRGGVLLTLLGALIMTYIAKILSLNGAPEHVRLLLKGVIIIVAVVIQTDRRHD